MISLHCSYTFNIFDPPNHSFGCSKTFDVWEFPQVLGTTGLEEKLVTTVESGLEDQVLNDEGPTLQSSKRGIWDGHG